MVVKLTPRFSPSNAPSKKPSTWCEISTVFVGIAGGHIKGFNCTEPWQTKIRIRKETLRAY